MLETQNKTTAGLLVASEKQYQFGTQRVSTHPLLTNYAWFKFSIIKQSVSSANLSRRGYMSISVMKKSWVSTVFSTFNLLLNWRTLMPSGSLWNVEKQLQDSSQKTVHSCSILCALQEGNINSQQLVARLETLIWDACVSNATHTKCSSIWLQKHQKTTDTPLCF